MAKTKRVNITIDRELHERARSVLGRLPAHPTFSSLVEDAVREMVPYLEGMVEAFEADGEEGALRVAEATLGRAMLGIHTHGARKDAE